MPGQARSAEQSGPPEPSGELLVSIARGESEQLRVSLDEYEGHPFISIRLWAMDRGGAWWPTKKGVTVRVRELGQVITALGKAAKQTGQGRQPRSTTRSSSPAPGDRPALPGLADPVEQESGDSFDEF